MKKKILIATLIILGYLLLVILTVAKHVDDKKPKTCPVTPPIKEVR